MTIVGASADGLNVRWPLLARTAPVLLWGALLTQQGGILTTAVLDPVSVSASCVTSTEDTFNV